MFDPFRATMEWQMACMRAWMQMCQNLVRMQNHMLNAEVGLLHGSPHRRRDAADKGAALDDHYGRRTHDIDVERDV